MAKKNLKKQKKRGGKQQRNKKPNNNNNGGGNHATGDGCAQLDGSAVPHVLPTSSERVTTISLPHANLSSVAIHSNGPTSINGIDLQANQQLNSRFDLAGGGGSEEPMTQPSSSVNDDNNQKQGRGSNCGHSSNVYPKPKSRQCCDICFLTLPLNIDEISYQSCCGKMICSGCFHQESIASESRGSEQSCAFCRQPLPPNRKTWIAQLQKRVQKHDPVAMHILASYYRDGVYGIDKNPQAEVELLHRSAVLRHPSSAIKLSKYYRLGYTEGGIQADRHKCIRYCEIAAYEGALAEAWHTLAFFYWEDGNIEAACYHNRVAAEYGHNGSLEVLKISYKEGWLPKADFAQTLRAWQASTDDMKSVDREKAKAHDDY